MILELQHDFITSNQSNLFTELDVHQLNDERVYLQDVRDDVFLTLFEKRVFVKGGVCLHDLRQHLRHFCLREKAT